MKYKVYLCTKVSIDYWMFDEEADAKSFYDEFFEDDLVLKFGRYDTSNEVSEVFESKSAKVIVIDD